MVIAASLAGCTPIRREDLEKEVVSKDPEFSTIMDKRKEVERRIETYKNELAVKRDSIQSQTKQLQRQLAEAVGQFNKKVAQAKGNMAPDRERLQTALSLANNALRAKQVERSTTARSVAQMKKSAQQSTPSAEDARQLDTFMEALKKLDQEIAVQKDQIHLLKLKLLLVRI